MKKLLRVTAWLWISGCALLPRQSVPPFPEHIRAAVGAGDKVEVSTRDGRQRELEVLAADDAGLRTNKGRILYADIESISVRRAGRLPNPCDGDQPAGCSVPGALVLTNEFHAEYAARFDAACAIHDFCYRHGGATYGFDRQACDDAFRAAMRRRCGEALELDLARRAECRLAASEFHLAVRRYGQDRYQAAGSTYCEYLGPPAAVLQ